MAYALRYVSDVEVTFTDGEVKTYRISAGVAINGYLVREAGSSGVLSLFNKDQSWAIPLSGVREWTVKPVYADEPSAPATGEG